MEISPLGDRIAQIRIFRAITQQELADRAGVSKEVVCRLEQGARDGLRIKNLYKVVDALDARIRIEVATEDDIVKEQDRALLLPLRRLLLPVFPVGVPIDEEGLTLAKLRTRVLDSTADFDKARYAKLATEIPMLVSSIQAAVGMHEGKAREDAYRLLAHSYILTAQTVILLRDESLACEAVRRAMEAAENAGDPMLRAMAAKNYTWAFTRQGMFADAGEVAVKMADEIGEPSIKKATPGHLAVWGELHRIASRAAARDNRPDVAAELLSAAHSAAVRIDGGRMDYGKYWTVLNSAMIGIVKAENALVGGDAVLALRIGKGVRWTPNLHLDMWTNHLLNRAKSQASTRDYAGAIETLKSIRRIAPEWIKNDRDAHDVAHRLLDHTDARRAKSTGLAELLRFMDVEP